MKPHWTISLCSFLVLGTWLDAGAQEASRFTAEPLQADSRYEARKQRSRTDLVSVIVKLESDSLLAYRGGIAGLAATSPDATGGVLDVRAPRFQAYSRHLDREHRAFEDACSRIVPAAKAVHRYKVVLSGMSVLVPRNQVDRLETIPGVRAVYRDELLELDTERSPRFIGAPRLWRQLGGRAEAGEGTIVGILDSGIWPEHPSFSDPDPDGNPYPAPPSSPAACDFGNTSYNPADAPFSCNNKLIGAYSFLNTYKALIGLLPTEFDSARDDNGHGSHTASTAAGNANVAASVFDIPRGSASGIAPRAHVIAYRVCGDEGCFTSDSAAAVQQAILDGVDVLNFSIGGGSNPYDDAVSLAFLDAYDAGVFVAASAGNSGPGPDTVSHLEPWTATVAASTTDRHFLSDVVLNGNQGNQRILTGATITEGIESPTRVVFPPAGQEQCNTAFPTGTFSGEIVICQRGVSARVEKSYNVAQGGASGMLLYNPTLQGLATDNHFVPTVHLENDAGAELLDFMAANPAVFATFADGTATRVQGDVMAPFSSRGGPGQTLGVSKPDVTAPGVQILAGNTPMPATVVSGLPGELFQVIQGTSMSSPHVAGAGALLRDLHPDWSPGEIKSALMTTARLRVTKEDGVTPSDPFDRGSGRIDLRRAGDPGLTFSDDASAFLALEDHLWDANYPSLYVPANPGSITVERTAKSQLSHPRLWFTHVSAPSDLDVRVPFFLYLPANGERSFEIEVDARDVPLGETRFANLRLRSGHHVADFPITIVKRDADVVLDKSCAPTDIARGELTSCTITLQNSSFDDASVHLVDALPRQLDLVNGSVGGGANAVGNSVVFDGVLQGPEPPGVLVVPGASPAGGYLPLSTFGIPPFSDVDDESILNFTVDAFEFAQETWTQIGMVSNGYLVVGGGTSADITYINQGFPDSDRPNNVLAPFWTDLNPAFGGTLKAVTLTNGVEEWMVFEWENVVNYSDREPNSFQVWIGVNGVEDISYVYDVVSDGDLGFLTVGAENKFGNRGDNYYLDGAGTLPDSTTELNVRSTPGAPAPIHTISFDAFGVRRGKWENCAQLTSNLFAGRTVIDCVKGEVARLR
jgi:hypothetical protein